MTTDDAIRSKLARCQKVALLVAVCAAVACGLGYWLNPARFFQAYLVAFLYLWTAAMGCLGLALIYQMTGGRWGYAARPFFDAGARTLPLLAVLFVPLALGIDSLYAWADPELFRGDEHAHARAWYLSESFFLGRSAGYVIAAAVIGFAASIRAADSRGVIGQPSWPTVAGLATVVSVLLVTFAAFDWGMSLDPYWYSTMYGAIFLAGGLLVAMCLVTAGAAMAVHWSGRSDPLAITILHDQANLILAFLMVWAYLSLSQFLIIYAGNLPVEVVWYLPRLAGGWQVLAILLVVLHFFAPFLLLLSRDIKREPRRIALLAIGLAVVHLLETYWVIMPSFHGSGLSLHWLDLAVPAALAALLLVEFLRQLKSRLMPVLAHWPHAEKTPTH